MTAAVPPVSAYGELFKYLLVFDEKQIIKLRKIATGILSLSAFSEEEIHVLESRLILRNEQEP